MDHLRLAGGGILIPARTSPALLAHRLAQESQLPFEARARFAYRKVQPQLQALEGPEPALMPIGHETGYVLARQHVSEGPFERHDEFENRGRRGRGFQEPTLP